MSPLAHLREPAGLGASSADQLLAQAQADLSTAQGVWAFLQSMAQNAEGPCGGGVDGGLANLLQGVSRDACSAANLATQAAGMYAQRCSAAASAAAGARPCDSSAVTTYCTGYPGGLLPAGSAWGTVWNGQANCIDRNCMSKVGDQLARAQASVNAAMAAKTAACSPSLPRAVTLPSTRFRFGVGVVPVRSGIGDASTYIAQAAGLPGAGDAWANVQSTLQAEGQSPDNIGGAAISFVNAYNQISLVNGSIQVSDWANAAASFTLNNHSIGAAVGQVTDLVSAIVNGGNPNQVFQAFSGTLVAATSIAIGASVVSFGVGAAIIAGIEILGSIIGFNQPPPPIAVVGACPVYASTPPTIVDGWTWSWGVPTTHGPKSQYWRTFPDPNRITDAGWFQGYQGPFANGTFSNSMTWNWPSGAAGWTDTIYTCFGFNETGKRPVDQIANEPQGPPVSQTAGPSVYHHLECEAVLAKAVLASNPQDTLANFQLAYFAAWKANREYGLNGLQQQSDADVLSQLVKTWNRAHGGAPITINASNDAPLSYNAPQPQSMTPYVAIVLGSARGQGEGSVTINGFAPKSIPISVHGGLRPGGITLIGGAGAGSGSTARDLAIGAAVVAGGGLLAAYLVARHRRTSTKAVLKGTWKDVKREARKLGSGVKKIARKVHR